jgi:uncharacterized cupredoxin-like copper-binding protein
MTLYAIMFGASVAQAHEDASPKRSASAADKQQQAWGIAGDAKNARRTIEVSMTDNMRFTPSRIEVLEGETVRFVIRNRGQVMHEMVIGTADALKNHAALMQKFPKMEHDEPHMAHVASSKKGELVWKFNRRGDFSFACLIPGHYEAGMTGTITVLKQ